MPGVQRTGRSVATRTARTSRTSLTAAGAMRSRSDPDPLSVRRKTPAEEKAAKQKRMDELRAKNAEVFARNAALHAEEAERDADEAALEEGYAAPTVAVQDGDDEDDEHGQQDALPPSDDEDDEIPIASSDPIDFDASSDDILVTFEKDPFVTPAKKVRKRRRASDDDGDDDAPPAKSGKVTKADMTPRTQRFTGDVKAQVVLVTATDNPYPGSLNREVHVEGIMAAVVDKSGDPEHEDTFRRLKRMPEKFQAVVAWVLYARGAFVHQLAVVCRQHVASLGIPGSMKPHQVVDVVTWLLKTEAWKFGGLDLLKRDYNRAAPFGAPFFESVARSMFMEGRKKQSGETFRHLIEVQRLPLVFMALTMTAIEHCLTEWRVGTQRRADFKEDASVRYLYHLAGLEHVRDKAPTYIDNLQSILFKDMLVHTNKTFLLEAAVSDALGSLDFAALEKSVGK
ncbi:hypothetical protein BDZ89DRAFT_1137135 [Hymenopellis radicata]|nr:hypothetical protein BDZ89DRAFT_1137135 [Hymenopellis radicata]